MKEIKRANALEYLFDHRQAPIVRIKPGESLRVFTEDAFAGEVKSLEDLRKFYKLPISKIDPGLCNPTAGPIYVEGAEKGDTLVVHVEKIIVEDFGQTKWTPFHGPLCNSTKWPELGKYRLQKIKHLPGHSGTTSDGVGVLNDKISWNLSPFIGTIAVAPEVEVVTSAYGQGSWGGNLDCKDIKEGSIVQIPVFSTGGLLYLGDVHATQADTEFYGTADETRAEVTISCEVLKNKSIPFIRVLKPDSLVSLYCYRPLEKCVETAIVLLMEWLVEEYSVTPEEAYLHTTVNPDFRVNIYQMVRAGNLQFTAGAEIPKRYLRLV